ncbi:integrase-like protein [Tamilnaduibacter salinus]|uniref:Integrase n=1 Tax=Tamilnaduibacter salinus TaxID=1484056 RepID=A0A2A2I0M9_9GAMM|nr:phage integrase N-terminal SAM-like domain-containing protein [Tamilnaduibacter salinus]PAV25581.1 integrase [Tamilnaduibacter salinus]PVY77654.1 integrase-like protein [Tamilnaduibacter salinus]
MSEALEQSRPGLLARVNRRIQSHQLNLRTEQTYLHWITRYLLFYDMQDPARLGHHDIRVFLGYLEERMQVSQARLNQASQALHFLHEAVLDEVGATAVA